MKTLPLLTFHAIDERSSVISFSPALFERGMARLRQAGFRTITLQAAAEYLRRGKPFPERSVVLTFDDGYRSVYREAFPVLQKHGMTATVFLTSGRPDSARTEERLPELNGRERLSWREIREMARHGIDFGAHTLTHPDLTRLSRDAAEREIVLSQQIIQEALGSRVISFAYPFGAYDRVSIEIAKRHFDCACSARLGFITPSSELYALERLDAFYLRTDRLFALATTGWLEPYIAVRAVFRNARIAVVGLSGT